MSEFIGRDHELRQIQETLDDPKAGIIVVFGRRRIGKTELIRKALHDTRYLSFEGLENQPKEEQIDTFLFQLEQQTGNDYSSKRATVKQWKDAFALLIPLVRDEGYHLFLDEFQWLANYRSAIVSDLKMVWDQYLSRHGNTKLILCGSIASYMTKKILQSNALYGRVDLVIHLQEFQLSDTRRMLGGDRSITEIMEAHMMVGGIPRYLELVRNESSVRLAMEEHAFTRYGYFTDEYGRIFLSHFGKHHEYEEIIKLLAKHAYGLSRQGIMKLIKSPGGGPLSSRLDNLESAGFISKQTPFSSSPNAKRHRYCLTDPYLRFYFAFIAPRLKQINDGQQRGTLFARICDTGAYYSWLGRSFENLCYLHAGWIARHLGFSAVNYAFGPYFQNRSTTQPGVQIDMIYDRDDGVIVLCEAKYQQSPVGIDIIQEVNRKVEVLREHYPKMSIQKVLIAPNGVTKPVENARSFFSILAGDAMQKMAI